MGSKKGVEVPEFLKILIAALCILLLIWLTVKITISIKASKEKEQASAILKQIKDRIEFVGREKKTSSMILTGPKNWVFFIETRGEGISKETRLCTACSGKECLDKSSEESKICTTLLYDVRIQKPEISIYLTEIRLELKNENVEISEVSA